jgi:hypothetical protein
MPENKMILPAIGWDLADYLIMGGMLLMLGAMTYIMVKKLTPETVWLSPRNE